MEISKQLMRLFIIRFHLVSIDESICRTFSFHMNFPIDQDQNFRLCLMKSKQTLLFSNTYQCISTKFIFIVVPGLQQLAYQMDYLLLALLLDTFHTSICIFSSHSFVSLLFRTHLWDLGFSYPLVDVYYVGHDL